MYVPLRLTDVSNNVVKLLQGREVKAENSKFIQQHSQFTHSLIKRLGLENELVGHQGCVNCIEWSADGRQLASGSDDTNVIIWDPFTHRLLKTLYTPHIGNIFSVKFLGSNSSLVATGAGDCRVVVQSVEQAANRQAPHLDCGCHIGRVKRLAIAPDQPLLFWSASEDGSVIQYDMREQHKCLVKSTVFIDLSRTSDLKCIAVNPVKPHLIAIGANDCYVRLYDRRMVKTSEYMPNHSMDPQKRTAAIEQDSRCVQYYAPGHLAKDFGGDMSYKLAATYVTFNASGSEMLVNMGGEHIYLFDVNDPRYVNQLRVPDNVCRPKNVLQKSCCRMRGNGMASPPTSSSQKVINYNKRISAQPCVCSYIGRAKSLYHRKWTGDLYSAARDFLHVIHHCPDNMDAFIGLIKCLIALKWSDEAYQWIEQFQNCYPDRANSTQLSELLSDISAIKHNKEESTEAITEKVFTEQDKELRLASRDYEIRFLGHCNTTTDIKEANFLGEDGKFICAGSDDGLIFIWDRKTTNVVNALMGDVSIVNCVQPHPSACFIATSGIDSYVKLWSPMREDGNVNPRTVNEPWVAIEANQKRMSMDPFETMLANMGYRISPLEGQDIPCRTS